MILGLAPDFSILFMKPFSHLINAPLMNRKYIPFRIALLLSLVCWSPFLLAEDLAGSLSGRILDAASRGPIQGAQVAIPTLNLASLTDDLGFFSFSSVAPGAYEVQVSYLGYETIREQVSIDPSAGTVMQFALHAKIISIPEVTISENPAPWHRSLSTIPAGALAVCRCRFQLYLRPCDRCA
jgi:hypothetical protein